MDADDELEPGHLAGLWAGVATEVDVVVTGVKAIGLDGSQQHHSPLLGVRSGAQAATDLLIGHHSNALFPCWNKLYRRTTLMVAGLERPRMNYGEDQLFNLRVFRAMRGYISGVPGHTYRYIRREGSLMNSISASHIQDWLELWLERDEAAVDLFGDSHLASYRHRKMLSTMDFMGVVFRSRSRDLVAQVLRGLPQMAIRPALDWGDPVAVARWIKWKLRLRFGGRGLFPAWLM